MSRKPPNLNPCNYDYDFEKCLKIPMYALIPAKKPKELHCYSYTDITCAPRAVPCPYDLRYTTTLRMARKKLLEEREDCPPGTERVEEEEPLMTASQLFGPPPPKKEKVEVEKTCRICEPEEECVVEVDECGNPIDPCQCSQPPQKEESICQQESAPPPAASCVKDDPCKPKSKESGPKRPSSPKTKPSPSTSKETNNTTCGSTKQNSAARPKSGSSNGSGACGSKSTCGQQQPPKQSSSCSSQLQGGSICSCEPSQSTLSDDGESSCKICGGVQSISNHSQSMQQRLAASGFKTKPDPPFMNGLTPDPPVNVPSDIQRCIENGRDDVHIIRRPSEELEESECQDDLKEKKKCCKKGIFNFCKKDMKSEDGARRKSKDLLPSASTSASNNTSMSSPSNDGETQCGCN